MFCAKCPRPARFLLLIALTLIAACGNIASNHNVPSSTIAAAANTSPAAINSGGGQYTSQSGVVYQADTDYSGGTSASTTANITGTNDPALYQTERYGKTFSYNIPLANGNYNVILKFAEIYWNSSGQRVFNVSIQGTQVITNLDIYALVGKNAAYDVTFPASVTNGTLNIGFTTVTDNAKISAIEITPAATVSSFAANSGGGQYTSQSGVVYQADTDYSGGTSASTTANITGTNDPALYQTERYGKNLSYNIPLANGNYSVTLKFAEIYWNSSGQRVFNVYIQGTRVINNLDIYALVGKDAAYDVTFPASVTNGVLNIGFTAYIDNAKISAIEITPAASVSSFAANSGGGQYTSQSGVLYQADTDYSGGTPASTTANITGTNDPTLYQTERYGKIFSYNIPLANGNYNVTLRFAEIYWNSSGQRVFNVSIQGAQVITNLDIYALVGKNAAYDVTFPASVTNGVLNIGFTTVADNAKISAIEITPASGQSTYTITASAGTGGIISPSGTVTVNSGNFEPFTIAPFAGYTLSNVIVDGKSVGAVSSYAFSNVTSNHTISATFSIAKSTAVFAANSGGGQYTAQSGAVYQADTDYSGGTPASTTANITGTPDPALYQTERYGKTFSYNIPLANGNYDVTLKFAEIFWNSSGKRVFNVSIQGTQVITNLDIYALVGKDAAYDATFPASVTNGTLNIGFTTVVDNAKISAIEIAQEQHEFAYVADVAQGYISEYMIGADGSLTPLSTPTIGAGPSPDSITVDPTHKYAYVVNADVNNVTQYTIGLDGSLAFTGTPMVATGANPGSITADPSGRYAYVANFGSISQYTIGADGSLTPMSTPTVATGLASTSVTVDPTGKYVYVANLFGNSISQYTIGADGSLTPMSTPTVAAGSTPNSVAVDPTGKYAYVANENSNNVSQYTIGADGSLTPMSAPTVAAGANPNSVAVDPTGKYAYVANKGSNNVSQYTIGPAGLLTPLSTPTVAAGAAPYSVTVDPTGKYVYVANEHSDNVSQYTIGPDGSLTPMSTPTVATLVAPVSIVTW